MEQNVRGLEFRFTDAKSILSILDFIDVEKYVWHIPEEDVSNNNESDRAIFDRDIMDGNHLRRIIDLQDYRVDHINLRAFPSNEIVDLKTYNDFLASDCQFILLCYDAYFAEIYCKDRNIISNIYHSCETNPYISKLEYKTETDDPRTFLSVF